jgi:hypothetical protein
MRFGKRLSVIAWSLALASCAAPFDPAWVCTKDRPCKTILRS